MKDNLVEIKAIEERSLSTESVFFSNLNDFLKDVESGLRRSPDRVEEKTIQAFLTTLCNKLEHIGQQTVFLELRAMTTVHSGLTNEQARSNLSQDLEWPKRIEKVYPELARLLKIVTQNHATNCIEFCRCLKSDFNTVCQEFGIGHQYEDIDFVELCSAETHSGHLSVVQLFCDGIPVIGYKPRSLALESTVTEFIQHAMYVSGPPYAGLRTPTAIDKGTYGWVRWLPQKEVKTNEEAKVYFKRLGFLTALATALRIPDLHSGNLVAHGESPVFVDLETAFSHTRIREVDGAPLAPEIHWNCQETGLLPLWIWKGADMIGVDLSGIGALTPQYVSVPFYQMADDSSGSNEGLFRQMGVKLFPGSNVLHKNGETQFPWEYSKELEEGLEQGFTYIKAHLYDIDALSLKVENFSNRFIIKPTAGYHYVTQCSYHPEFMQDSESRRSFIRSSLTVNTDKELAIDVEVEACFNGDVPRFESTPSSYAFRDNGYGDVTLLQRESYTLGTKSVSSYIYSNLDNRLYFEKRLLSGAVSSLELFYKNVDALRSSKVYRFRDSDLSRNLTPDDSESGLLANARVVRSFLKEGEVIPGYWYGFRAAGTSAEFGMLGNDFYNGMGGIIFSLHLLQSAGREYSDISIDRLINVLSASLISDLRDQDIKLGGAYSGTASSLPICLQMLAKNNLAAAQEFGRESAELFLKKMAARRPYQGVETDLMAGAPGLVSICGSMYQLTSDPRWMEAVSATVDALISRKVVISGSVLFPSNSAVSYHPDACLTGLSHGQIGVAVGLANVINFFGGHRREQIRSIIKSLIKWEVSHFQTSIFNWFDYRKRAREKNAGEAAWSHGFPGSYLAFSYLAGKGFEEASEFLVAHPFEKAIDALLQREYRLVDDSLCQGALGIALIAKRILGKNQTLMAELLKWLRLSHFVELRQRPLRVNQVDIPGFWIGSAGGAIGYGELAGISALRVPLLPNELTEILK